jgi:uncharacterized protein YkwD
MKKILIILFILTVGGVLIYYFYPNYFNQSNKINLPQTKQLTQTINEIKKEYFAPSPLISKTSDVKNETKDETKPKTYLTNEGILKWTNFYRNQNGLKPLNSNPLLDKIATMRAKDMFEKQYFSHYSPQNIGVPQIAEQVGYEYIAIGENIALGNFKDDKDLVSAWMSSPGHRENILNSKYTEIGIAVLYNKFKDEKMEKEENVWIAVQIFGKPLSLCPQPDKDLKAQIDALKSQIESQKQIANTMLEDLKTNNVLHSREEVIEYNKKVEDYNTLVKEINKKVEELKVLVAKYNLQVEMFNNCINSN